MSGRSDALGPKEPANEVSLARLRRVLTDRFGSIPLLDHHLALMDSRGVLYATHAAESWERDHPEMLLGVVRHVIRTQCAGDPPDPDVEGWLAAGRPDHPTLGPAWDLVNLGRYGNAALSAITRAGSAEPSVRRLDQLLTHWPHLPTFVVTYARIERFIEAAGITLPPLTA